MIQTYRCDQEPPVFMAPHWFFNKSNNDHIKMQRHCLFQTLPPLGKTKLQSLICLEHVALERQAALTATCDERGREAEENNHIQKLQSRKMQKSLKVGLVFFSF